jgi:hypothetical protein
MILIKKSVNRIRLLRKFKNPKGNSMVKKFLRARGKSPLHYSEDGKTLGCTNRYDPAYLTEIPKEVAKAAAPLYFCPKCYPKGKPSKEEINANY